MLVHILYLLLIFARIVTDAVQVVQDNVEIRHGGL